MLNKFKNINRIIAIIKPGVIACLLFLRVVSYPHTSGFYFGYFYIKEKYYGNNRFSINET